MQGKLIVIEGIDGSGKSTQFKLLCGRLCDDKISFKQIVFPRYDEPSSALIRMYLGGEFGTEPDAVNAYAASSFFAVDRYASFVQDWRDYYQSGGIILTDRYTTSNAIHQGAKMASEERQDFFKWLYDYEFNLIGLPEPDMVYYMDIDVSLAAANMAQRQQKTDTNADIHEQDIKYLENCAKSGEQAAQQLGWHKVQCAAAGKMRDADEIHNEIYNKIKQIL